MELLRKYNEVNAILSTLDFQSIFDGFHKYKFALYTSNQICLDGKIIPYLEGFMGNTAISYQDEFIAIWDMEIDPIEDAERLAYCIVHEMFHCYQKDKGESRFPSDLVLLNYPDDIDNFIKKFNENNYLADAYINKDIEAFKKFHKLRNERQSVYPEMVLQELLAETAEGLAEYAGLKALKIINEEKFKAVTEEYTAKLQTADSLLFDIRKISYYTGAMYFLCLDIFDISEKYTFGGNHTTYEQNKNNFDGANYADVLPCDDISQKYDELIKKKKEIASEHIEKSKFIACDAIICGYDPMNMFKVGDIIYCSHFICLNIAGNVEMIKTAIALKLKPGSVKEIVGYYI